MRWRATWRIARIILISWACAVFAAFWFWDTPELDCEICRERPAVREWCDGRKTYSVCNKCYENYHDYANDTERHCIVKR